MCIGVVGSAVLAGTAFLVARRHSGTSVGQFGERSSFGSQSSRAYSAPPRQPCATPSPLKILNPNSRACSPLPGTSRSAASSPVLGTHQPSSPVRAGSPGPLHVLPPSPSRLTAAPPGSPVSTAQRARPLSPLRLPQASDDMGVSPGLKHSSSSADLEGLPTLESCSSPTAHSMPASPSQLVMARSVSFSEVAAVGCVEPRGDSCSTFGGSFSEPQPVCPRTTSFDGLPTAEHVSSRPASPAGLKLHVATVLRASAAAAAAAAAQPGTGAVSPGKLRVRQQGDGIGILEVGSVQQEEEGAPVDSPRGEAVLGVAIAVAAAMDQSEAADTGNNEGDGN